VGGNGVFQRQTESRYRACDGKALVAVIDEFRREQPHIPSRPEAIRILLKGQLVALGYIEAER
jgi:hypothetical protein